MIYIVANTKGGVGKSLTSVVVASMLHMMERKFKIIEIDDNQDSLQYSSSDVLTPENAISFSVDQKDDVVADLFFDLMEDPTMDYIVDIGGGNDTRVVEMLKADDKFEKTYIIPVNNVKKYIKNADDTVELINDIENTIFLLNGYRDGKKLDKEFIYFFGDKQLGIQPESKYFDKNKFLSIPFSNAFQFADDMEQTILDLAVLSIGMSESEANDMFFKQADGDRETFKRLRAKYAKSQIAHRTLNEIRKNFKILF